MFATPLPHFALFCLAILCNQVPSGDQEVALHGDDKVAVDNYVKVSISTDK